MCPVTFLYVTRLAPGYQHVVKINFKIVLSKNKKFVIRLSQGKIEKRTSRRRKALIRLGSVVAIAILAVLTGRVPPRRH